MDKTVYLSAHVLHGYCFQKRNLKNSTEDRIFNQPTELVLTSELAVCDEISQ